MTRLIELFRGVREALKPEGIMVDRLDHKVCLPDREYLLVCCIVSDGLGPFRVPVEDVSADVACIAEEVRTQVREASESTQQARAAARRRQEERLAREAIAFDADAHEMVWAFDEDVIAWEEWLDRLLDDADDDMLRRWRDEPECREYAELCRRVEMKSVCDPHAAAERLIHDDFVEGYREHLVTTLAAAIDFDLDAIADVHWWMPNGQHAFLTGAQKWQHACRDSAMREYIEQNLQEDDDGTP